MGLWDRSLKDKLKGQEQRQQQEQEQGRQKSRQTRIVVLLMREMPRVGRHCTRLFWLGMLLLMGTGGPWRCWSTPGPT